MPVPELQAPAPDWDGTSAGPHRQPEAHMPLVGRGVAAKAAQFSHLTVGEGALPQGGPVYSQPVVEKVLPFPPATRSLALVEGRREKLLRGHAPAVPGPETLLGSRQVA